MQSGRKSALSAGKRIHRAWRAVLDGFSSNAGFQASSGAASTAATGLRRAYTSEAAATLKAMANDARLGRSTRGAFALPAAVAAALAAAGTTVAHCSVRTEQTFIMVKPDGVNRGLCGEIIARFEKKGYKLVAAKVLVPGEETAKAHYAEHDGKPFFPKLVAFLTSGPVRTRTETKPSGYLTHSTLTPIPRSRPFHARQVLALVFEGKGVIAAGRKMIGSTNPLDADPSTIRGQNCIDVGRNCIHGSDSVDAAQREVSLWFSSSELSAYPRVLDAWIYE